MQKTGAGVQVDDGAGELTPLIVEESPQGRGSLLNRNSLYSISANVINFFGMVSLGALSMMIMDNISNNKGLGDGEEYFMDANAFVTTTAGKFAITYFFCKLALVAALWATSSFLFQGKIPDYFRVDKRTKLENLDWAVRTFLGFFPTVFWGGLVESSALSLSALLLKRNSESLNNLGEYASIPAVYGFPMACSLLINAVGWFSVFALLFARISRVVKNFPNYLLHANADGLYAHRQFLREIHPSRSVVGETPMLDVLYQKVSPGGDAASINDKLLTLPEFLTTELIQEMKNAAVEQGGLASLRKRVFHSLSYKCLKLFIAIALSVIGIIGFKNVLDLNTEMWARWGAAWVSEYGGKWVVLLGASEVAFSLIPPLTDGMLDGIVLGPPVQVFSQKKFVGIAFLSAYVGLFSGFANGQQSRMAGGSVSDVVTAVVASALPDIFALFSLGKSWAANVARDKKRDFRSRSALFLDFQENYHPDRFVEVETTDTRSITSIQA